MINSFKNYLVEEEKTIFFTFGRMNPPTVGHEKLLDMMSRKSGNNPYRVFLSQTQDKNKNPLSYPEKVKFARKMFPRHARSIILNKSIKNFLDAATSLYNEGYKNVVMVVGSDRVREFEILLKKYNGKKGKHGLYLFNNISVISAGDRDPDSDSVEGMSASKMRAAAKDNNFTQFSQGMPKAVTNAEAKKIYNIIRSRMGLKEQKEFKNHVQLEPVSDLRENYVQGNLFAPGDTIVVKETGQLGKVKHLGSNYVIIESTGNEYRKWIDAVEKLDENGMEIEVAPFSVQRESLQEKTTSPQDPDIKDRPGTQPKAYYSGLKSKSTKKARDTHFKKYSKYDDDNPAAYKKAPGDATAKTKPSKHTKRFKQMFGEQDSVDVAKKRIDREKKQDKIRHDRMMDRARLRDTRKKNRETT